MTTTKSSASSNFNPLPRKEGDEKQHAQNMLSVAISIHSLVKRETTISRRLPLQVAFQIHSLVKRETAV